MAGPAGLEAIEIETGPAPRAAVTTYSSALPCVPRQDTSTSSATSA
jgi:hypothetical protein